MTTYKMLSTSESAVRARLRRRGRNLRVAGRGPCWRVLDARSGTVEVESTDWADVVEVAGVSPARGWEWGERRITAALKGITVPVLETAPDDWRSLIPAAVAVRNTYVDELDAVEVAEVSDSFAARMVVNHIRHEYTTYECALWAARGRSGCLRVRWVDQPVYDTIRSMASDSIAARWPDLAKAAEAVRVARFDLQGHDRY